MRLGVNVDHIATLREARKGREPDPVQAAVLAELGGADGITVHLRGDRRHIKERDIEILGKTVTTHLNVEMAATINLLRQQENTDTALWYVSDHGESLGENGMYLHAAPYAVAPKEQTHVPMIFWASENWYRHTGVSAACMKQSADKAYSHDNWFHSVLGINDVHTQAYQRDLDIFAVCRS